MDEGTVIVRFKNLIERTEHDIDIPLNITANELVQALNEGYKLGIDTSNIKNCFLTAENPITLLKGNRTLGEYGIRNGSIIYYKGRG